MNVLNRKQGKVTQRSSGREGGWDEGKKDLPRNRKLKGIKTARDGGGGRGGWRGVGWRPGERQVPGLWAPGNEHRLGP